MPNEEMPVSNGNKNVSRFENKSSSVLKIVVLVLVIIIVGAAAFRLVKKPRKVDTDNLIATETSSNTSRNSQSSTKVTYDTLGFDQPAAVTDPIGDKNGPFYHKVYTATSSDGLTFTKTNELVADKSSVPDVVKTAGDALFVYAVDGAMRSKNGLMVSVSKDAGKSWKSGSLNLAITDKDYPAGADPEVVLLPDGRVRLFYVAFPKQKPPLDSTGKPIPTDKLNKIKTAISSDGLNFEEEPGVRYESTRILTDPDVVKIGSPSTGSGQAKWFMYLSDGSKNVAFSSDDGNTFTEVKTIREQGSVSKTVAIDGSQYRQFFCKDGISSATTTDGLNFTDDSGTRLKADLGEIICDPSPIKLDSGWLMIYKSATMPLSR